MTVGIIRPSLSFVVLNYMKKWVYKKSQSTWITIYCPTIILFLSHLRESWLSPPAPLLIETIRRWDELLHARAYRKEGSCVFPLSFKIDSNNKKSQWLLEHSDTFISPYIKYLPPFSNSKWNEIPYPLIQDPISRHPIRSRGVIISRLNDVAWH